MIQGGTQVAAVIAMILSRKIHVMTLVLMQSLSTRIENRYITRLSKIDATIFHCIFLTVVIMLRSSMRINAEKVIVTMLVMQLSEKIRMVNIITIEPWQMLIDTQIKKVLKERRRPFQRSRYRRGYYMTLLILASQSNTRENTGSEVQTVVQPSIRSPLQMGIAAKQKMIEKIA